MHSFFGLFGLYYSLRYLSLSDAVVLTFLSPLTTAISGSCLLGETFTKREALAGGALLNSHTLPPIYVPPD